MSIARQHVNQFGKPKRKFHTHQEAVKRRDEIIAETGWHYQAYKCKVCECFHVGGKEYWKVRRSQVKREEMLVGKLVYAIRRVLDKGLRAT